MESVAFSRRLSPWSFVKRKGWSLWPSVADCRLDGDARGQRPGARDGLGTAGVAAHGRLKQSKAGRGGERQKRGEAEGLRRVLAWERGLRTGA
eukprot:239503-Pleurochrysis_carterae.AAC.1